MERPFLELDEERNALTNLPSQLDSESQRLQDDVDQVVRRFAEGDDREYVRRWKQLLSWSYNRTQGDPVKKKKLKKRLLESRGSKCEDCKRDLKAPELQMHRVDPTYANDRRTNMGYFDTNVLLLCVICHRQREGHGLDS